MDARPRHVAVECREVESVSRRLELEESVRAKSDCPALLGLLEGDVVSSLRVVVDHIAHVARRAKIGARRANLGSLRGLEPEEGEKLRE